jgi:probable rRNA maturation factor
VKIRISNRQKAVETRRGALKKLAESLAAAAFDGCGGEAPGEVTVTLTDNAGMPGYKERCFGVRVQTDVVSQMYAGIPGVVGATGEMVVNAERAREEGAKREGGTARELALYVAHGFDHLAGADDDTPSRRRAMRRRETRWLAAREGLWRELVVSD